MNHDIVPVSAELAEDIVFESELIPSYGDMEMMLTQEGIRITRHVKTFLSEIAPLPVLDADGAARLASRLGSDPAAKFMISFIAAVGKIKTAKFIKKFIFRPQFRFIKLDLLLHELPLPAQFN